MWACTSEQPADGHIRMAVRMRPPIQKSFRERHVASRQHRVHHDHVLRGAAAAKLAFEMKLIAPWACNGVTTLFNLW
jgi:hypothetical protein